MENSSKTHESRLWPVTTNFLQYSGAKSPRALFPAQNRNLMTINENKGWFLAAHRCCLENEDRSGKAAKPHLALLLLRPHDLSGCEACLQPNNFEHAHVSPTLVTTLFHVWRCVLVLNVEHFVSNAKLSNFLQDTLRVTNSTSHGFIRSELEHHDWRLRQPANLCWPVCLDYARPIGNGF